MSANVQTWMVEDLPLLGETFAVELANTLYDGDGVDLDFLADANAITTWSAHAPAAAGMAVPKRLSSESVATIRRIRDATRQLLADAAIGARSASGLEAADVLHRGARHAAAHLALDVSGNGTPTWHVHYDGRDDGVFVATVASRCILFLGGDEAGRVRQCERSDCPLYFVQRHRARRFCDESCSHSTRQARYYRSLIRQRRAEATSPRGQHAS